MQADFDKALTQDLGKDTFVNWVLEFTACIRECDDAISNLKSWMKDECVHTPMLVGPGKSYIQNEPMGVVVVLGSWNYPIGTLIPPVISAIAAGNAVVAKPSEMAPWTAQITKRLFGRNMDTNCYQCVNGGVEIAKRSTSTPSDLIVFTGSTEKGKLVASSAAKNLVPCILELGGKCPFIVDKGCDLDYAANKCATVGFMNSGQLCIRSDYVLIESSLANPFIAKLKEYIKKGFSDKSALGNVINQFHHDRLCKLMADHQGAVVVGNANASEDKNLTPSVILNPSPDSPIM